MDTLYVNSDDGGVRDFCTCYDKHLTYSTIYSLSIDEYIYIRLSISLSLSVCHIQYLFKLLPSLRIYRYSLDLGFVSPTDFEQIFLLSLYFLMCLLHLLVQRA